MITVEEARRTAAKRLRTRMRDWAGQEALGTLGGPVFELGLKPPSQNQVLADQLAAETWVRTWRDAERRLPLQLEWQTRAWAALGRQEIPVRVHLSRPDDLATFVGAELSRDWRRLRDRAAVIRTRWPGSVETDAVDFAAVLRAQANTLIGLSDADFITVLDVVGWLADNPLGTMRPRQLPIRGVDSKWFGGHRSLVTALLGLTGAPARLDILDAEALVRIRICDPSLRPGGMRDLIVPVDQLAALPLDPHTVLVFENLESVLALPDLPGVVAVHGSGYAVDAVGRIPWATSARVLYWGDLDSHGFAILGRLRSHVPEVRSLLMDEDTLLAHRDLWVTEPKPFRGRVHALTGGERRALERLHAEGNVRLEQERIPWSHALTVITAAACDVEP